jgi:hypothetical protein
MHSLDPKRVVQQTWSSLKSRRGDESCRRNHHSGRLADDLFPSISKGLSVASPSSDLIRTSYPVFLQKGSFCQPSGFPRAMGDLSHRRWLEGQNLIDNYAGARLGGRADIAAGTAGLRKNRTFRDGGTMCSSPWSRASGFRNSKTRSDPGGGHRRTSNRRRQGPHACEPASLLGRRSARNDAAACLDEPIAAPFLNSQDAPCPRDKISGRYLLLTRATVNHRDAVPCILDGIVSEQGPRVVGSGRFIRSGRFRPCHKRRLFRRGRREGIGRTCARGGGSLLQLVEPCRETGNF